MPRLCVLHCASCLLRYLARGADMIMPIMAPPHSFQVLRHSLLARRLAGRAPPHLQGAGGGAAGRQGSGGGAAAGVARPASRLCSHWTIANWCIALIGIDGCAIVAVFCANLGRDVLWAAAGRWGGPGLKRSICPGCLACAAYTLHNFTATFLQAGQACCVSVGRSPPLPFTPLRLWPYSAFTCGY